MSKLSKIALIVVVLACVGSLYFTNQLKGMKKDQQEQIAQLTTTLTGTSNTLVRTQKSLQDTTVGLSNAVAELAATNAVLQTKQVELTAKIQEIETCKKQVEDVTKQVADAKAETATAKEEHAKLTKKLEDVGIKPVEEAEALIKGIKLQLTIASDESKVFGQQIVVMHDDIDTLNARIVELTTTPPGLRAHVVTVNPDWGFVVLDVGKDQHVQPNTMFLLYRDNKLVAKALVRSVTLTSCVADLLPDFTQMPPHIGDGAVYYASK